MENRLSWILGISAFYHDASVTLLRDGEILFAASEEIFSRRKHDAGFPKQALAAAFDFAGITAADLSYVGFYEKPLLKFERLLETYLTFAPAGYRSYAAALPSWLRTKLHIKREIRKHLPGYDKRIIFCEHHESHAASAFFPSPYREAAILTVDGVGEWASTAWGIGRENKIELRGEQRFPHSLGLLYSAFTSYCGFRVNSGEYKLMGLAPYGKPVFYDLLCRELLRLRDDGSFQLNMQYFGYCQTLRMTTPRMVELLGFAPRRPDEPLRDCDRDLAASVQRLAEEILLRMVTYVQSACGLRNLVMAGGVALNCAANSRLLRDAPVDAIWVQPAAGDAGGSLGVAMFIWHQLLGMPRVPKGTDAMQQALLGPAVDAASEMPQLLERGAVARRMQDPDELNQYVATLLAEGAVVGWVQGRQEFGPRALGNRSILADPRRADMQRLLNLKIKNRESFRPFAPAVLEIRAGDYFELERRRSSPYMLFTARCLTDDLPAVTHVDHSSRVQTVCPILASRFHDLIRAFDELTGCPVLINTSFNVRGEPIVCTAEQAYRCFLATDMDALVIDDFLMINREQPEDLRETSRRYLLELESD
ncbi:MAG: carbamoyltransferase N-terminal domain-containing protein [Pirellulaceae bacterium]